MILVGISGKKGTGKDLLASYLKQKYGFMNLPFAEELKERVRQDFGLTLDHTDGKLKESLTEYIKEKHWIYQNTSERYELTPFCWTPREIMIAYGQFFRQFDPLYWVKKVFDKIHEISVFYTGNKSNLRFCISDVRFQNEANYIKENGGFLVRLERKSELNIYKEQSTDLSEVDLDNYDEFDLVLNAENNIVPEDLERFADNIMVNIEAKVK